MMQVARVALLCLLSGCTSLVPHDFRTFLVEPAVSDERTLPATELHVRSGQVIVSDSGGADSLLLSIMGEQFTPFVHAGIVSIEGDRAYVYEGYATIRPYLHGPPTDAMHGSIRRVSLKGFLARQKVVAIFDPPSHVDMRAVVQFSRERHADRTPFDAYFDWSDHSRLYCTEFAALALQAGGADLPIPVAIRRNPSLRIALDWLHVSTDEIVTVAALTRDLTPTVLVSRRLDRAAIDAYFAAKQELHRRFTSDQKLGNLWAASVFGLRLRPEVQDYLDTATARPHEPAAAIATSMFGPPESAALAVTR